MNEQYALLKEQAQKAASKKGNEELAIAPETLLRILARMEGLEDRSNRAQFRNSEMRKRIETLAKENCALRDICRQSKILEEVQFEHRSYLEGKINDLVGEVVKLEEEADWLAQELERSGESLKSANQWRKSARTAIEKGGKSDE